MFFLVTLRTRFLNVIKKIDIYIRVKLQYLCFSMCHPCACSKQGCHWITMNSHTNSKKGSKSSINLANKGIETIRNTRYRNNELFEVGFSLQSKCNHTSYFMHIFTIKRINLYTCMCSVFSKGQKEIKTEIPCL